MNRSKMSILLKFLVGILLVQGFAAVLVYAGLQGDRMDLWPLLAGLGLGIGVLTAFWFSSIATHMRNDAVARARESFLRERERIKVRTERDKAKMIKASQQQLAKERNRVQNRANVKVWASFAAAFGVGALMLLTQFVTLGMVMLTTAGGAVGGYLFRVRQEGQADEKQGPRLASSTAKLVRDRVVRPARRALSTKTGETASRPPASPG